MKTSNIYNGKSEFQKRMLGPIPYLKSSDEWFKPGLYFYPDTVTPFSYGGNIHSLKLSQANLQTVLKCLSRPKMPKNGIYASVSGRPIQDADGNWRGGIAVFSRSNRESQNGRSVGKILCTRQVRDCRYYPP